MEDNFFDFSYATLIGIITWFFGGLDSFVQVLITFAAIDYITGICASIIQKQKLSSDLGFKGITRKVYMFILVGMAHIIDFHILGDSQALKTAVCLFYIGNEGISILENAHKMNIPIPKFLEDKILHFTDQDNHSEQK